MKNKPKIPEFYRALDDSKSMQKFKNRELPSCLPPRQFAQIYGWLPEADNREATLSSAVLLSPMPVILSTCYSTMRCSLVPSWPNFRDSFGDPDISLIMA